MSAYVWSWSWSWSRCCIGNSLLGLIVDAIAKSCANRIGFDYARRGTQMMPATGNSSTSSYPGEIMIILLHFQLISRLYTLPRQIRSDLHCQSESLLATVRATQYEHLLHHGWPLLSDLCGGLLWQRLRHLHVRQPQIAAHSSEYIGHESGNLRFPYAGQVPHCHIQ